MVKFYKIPLTERLISTENGPLIDILREQYPCLYEREQERIQLTYGDGNSGTNKPQTEDVMNAYNEQTQLQYQLLGLPSYIIAVQGHDEQLKEYATDTILTAQSDSILKTRRVTAQEAYKYLDKIENYESIVTKLFAKPENKELRKSQSTSQPNLD